jgi:hypothetical protein
MEFSMKLTKTLHGVLIGSAFLLAADAFAANKGALHVTSPETVAGERLTAGDYTVRWEGAGPSVQLRIMQGEKVLVAAPAKLVALDSVSPSDSVIVDVDGNGSRTLSQIFFSGKRFALQVEEGSATAAIHGTN